MLANAFIGKTKKPTDAELNEALGRARARWDRLLDDLAKEHSLTTTEWNSYSPKYGWALRLKQAKRNIVYLCPARGGFTAGFALGGKAIEAARRSGLPQSALDIIDGAKKYPEGTAVYIEVKSAADIQVVSKLVAAKLAN
jgi:hypothetical protein